MIRRAVPIALIAMAGLVLAAPALATHVTLTRTGLHAMAAAGEDNWYQVTHVPRSPTYCPHAPHGCFDVSDLNPNTVTVGRGCFIYPGTPGIARCQDPGGRVPLHINAGDMDDTVGTNHASNRRPDEIPALIHGGAGADYVVGGAGNDRIFGKAGDDKPSAGGGLYGGAGNDAIKGGQGSDREDGETGDDTLGNSMDVGVDYFYGGEGDDFLDARDGVADGTIDCGPGPDSTRRDGGLDPPATSC